MSMTPHDFDKYCPDLVISIGKHFWSFIKYSLRANYQKFNHWRVSTDGAFMDGFKSLTDVFKCTPEIFLLKLTKLHIREKTTITDNGTSALIMFVILNYNFQISQ